MKSFDQEWEKIHSTTEWGAYPSENIIRFVARNFYQCDRKQIKLLDFGCGGGAHTWYMAREGFDVYAFDGSKSASEKTIQKLSVEGLKAQVSVMDGAELTYEDNFFDGIIDNVSIYANKIEHIKQMYQNCYRCLKPGGKMITICFSVNTYGYGSGMKIEENTYRDLTEGRLSGRGIVHFFTKEEVQRVLEDCGFKICCMDIDTYTDCSEKVENLIIQIQK